MLYYAFVFFIIAIIAGLFGFGLVASAFASIAKILFWVFIVIAVISLLAGGFHGRRFGRNRKLFGRRRW